ncbi:Cloroperoxidase [Mycena venus]|uniref:Cloroperoxidase n=1 Tax=Mycena venus TaxID=2733690 RepID=A0A8H6Y6E1_9AGAR|nr:Cloroperoxidase [Mycena venus]
MRSFGSAKTFAVLCFLLPAARATPTPTLGTSATPTTEVQDGQTGTLMVLPPQATETGLKQIPWQMPIIRSLRQAQATNVDPVVPAMNTLANHGYISRNGVSTLEELVNGMMEAFNVDVNFAGGLAAVNFLTRGNPFVNKVSIGGPSPLVPPLPGNIDGPVALGIAAHGRLEGDVSLTRADAAIGDSVNFQDQIFDGDLVQLGKFGENGPDGNNTVFNVATAIGIFENNFARSLALNPRLTFNAARMSIAYGTAGLWLTVFQNGTTNQSTLPIIASFMRNQTFPPNWYRAASPISGSTNAKVTAEIQAAIPILPGRKNAQGVYVADPAPPFPFNTSFVCTAYYDQAAHMPVGLANTTGIYKQNVDLLTGILFAAANRTTGCTQFAPPSLPSGA